MNTLYLFVDFFTIIIPLLFSFHPKINFYKSWGSFFLAAIPVAVLFCLWDSLFTQAGIWNFNPRYLLGIYIFHLPIEEILFFICIPFSCVFTYFCLDKFFDMSWKPMREKGFAIFLAIFLFVIGGYFIDRAYTAMSFLSTAIICLFLVFVVKVDWFGKAVTVYMFLLVPFMIVNGILTGTGIEEAVVRYDNSENLGIRILTIPVEDIFYGLELFLLVLFLFKSFETIKMHHRQKTVA